jgi:hypothetical protein
MAAARRQPPLKAIHAFHFAPRTGLRYNRAMILEKEIL